MSEEKVKEEIGELIEAIENNSNKVHEAAVVLYHLLVYLEGNGVRIEDIMDELEKIKKKKSLKKTKLVLAFRKIKFIFILPQIL